MIKNKDFLTNMSDEQLKEQYEKFLAMCDDCKEIHSDCRVKTPCSSCKIRPFISCLYRYFYDS
jgi:hypothetical protein